MKKPIHPPPEKDKTTMENLAERVGFECTQCLKYDIITTTLRPLNP